MIIVRRASLDRKNVFESQPAHSWLQRVIDRGADFSRCSEVNAGSLPGDFVRTISRHSICNSRVFDFGKI